MSTPPVAPLPSELLRKQAADDLRNQLARHDAYKEDVKNFGEQTAGIKATLFDWITEAGKHWCGAWYSRECHEGGRLGEKCKGYNCGSYMMTHYDSDPNGKAKYDEWFANDPNCWLVQQLYHPDTDTYSYRKRERWWADWGTKK